MPAAFAKDNINDRLKASGLHLAASAVIAVLAAALVFYFWFPWPFRIVSGGKDLFLLLISVDVILGPLLTFAVFNKAKPRTELVRDLSIIVLIQLAALGYGLYTVFLARPVVVAHEVDRFRVVSYVQVEHEQLNKALPEFQRLSLMGPVFVGTRKSTSDEFMKSVDQSLQGLEVSMRPNYWIPYAQAKESILKRAKPVSVLRKQYPRQSALIDTTIAETKRKENELVFLPLHARTADWSIILDAKTAEPVGYIALDGFF